MSDDQPTTHRRTTPEDQLSPAPAQQVSDIQAALHGEQPVAWSSMDLVRSVKERQAPDRGKEVYEHLIHELARFERKRAATLEGLGAPSLIVLAESYDRVRTEDDRVALAAEVAEKLTLAQAGTIRRAAEAVKLATINLIVDAAATGTEASTIAKELSVTSSYVRRVLRENKAMT